MTARCPVFSVKLEVEGSERTIRYEAIPDCVHDTSLKALFSSGLVEQCLILDCKGCRIAGLPFMTWENLVDRLISNSTVIYRRAFTDGA